MPLLILPPSDICVPQPPLSPYCIPLDGSSGLISPSSILVKIIRASRPKTSSIFSPDRADTSTETGIPCVDAHRDASSADISRPSGAIVTVCVVPKPVPVLEDMVEARDRNGFSDLSLSKLEEPTGVSISEGWLASWSSSSRSALFPTRSTVRSGEVNARASFRNVGSALKESRDERS